jgi:hypothetical protein
MVVIDPPECFPQPVRNGFIMSGWQFQERVLLAPWFTRKKTRNELRRRFGRGAKTEETFGQPTAKGLLEIYRVLAEAPQRLQRAAEFFLESPWQGGCAPLVQGPCCITNGNTVNHVLPESPWQGGCAPLAQGPCSITNGNTVNRVLPESDPPEALWISFAGLHLASHQFFDLSLLGSVRVSEDDRRRLERAIADILMGYDRTLGRILERLPAGSDRVVFCTKGIGPVIGWVDLLPEMLRRVLGAPAVSSPVSVLRARVPRAWRERVAGALPDSMATELAARLWSPRADWSRTQAFTLPSDSPGFIRLNLRGRERFGCVAPGEEAGLCGEIIEGLTSFTDLDGEPCIRKILRPREIFGEGERLHAFPDLVVLWTPKKTLRGRGVRSPRFGEILRRGESGTGRSGDHAEGALIIVAPGTGTFHRPDRQVEPYDIPATILSALGLPHDDLPGQALLKPS